MSNVDKLLRYPAGVCSNPAMRNKRHGVKNNLRVYEIIKPVFYSLSLRMSHPTALYNLNGHLFPLVVANPNLPLVHFPNAELSLANRDMDGEEGHKSSYSSQLLFYCPQWGRHPGPVSDAPVCPRAIFIRNLNFHNCRDNREFYDPGL